MFFSIIDDEIDADKIKEMLVNAIHTEGYKNHYYKKGVDYRVERIGTIISVYMRAETGQMQRYIKINFKNAISSSSICVDADLK